MSLLSEYDFFLFLPEIFLTCTVLFLLVYGVVISKTKSSWSSVSSNSLFKGKGEEIHLLVVHITWISFFCVFVTGLLVWNMPFETGFAFSHSLVIDQNTIFCKLFILLTSASCFFISFSYYKNEGINAFEYIVLLLLSTCSMLLMVSSHDLLSFYVTLELQSLIFYVLAASQRNSEFSTEAGIKYFLLGAFSSGIFLFGASMIYGCSGTTQFGSLSQLFTGFAFDEKENHGMLVGVLCVSIGFLFKLGAAPFHMWAPDVYEGSPTPITAFFSIVPKIALLSVFLRFFVVGLHEFPWQPCILVCSLISMFLGALGALSQTKIKRLLAFSAIGHIGYILMGTCCATVEGIQSVYIYVSIYACMTLCMFAFVLSLTPSILQRQELYVREVKKNLRYIEDLSILSSTNPLLAFTCAACLFSLAGIPPLAGFCSKFFLFFAALSSSLYLVAFMGILASCVSCFYYIRIIKIMYFEKPVEYLSYDTVDKEKGAILAVTLFLVLFFFLYPEPLFVHSHKLALLFVS